MKGGIHLPQFQTKSVIIMDIEKVVWPFGRFQGNKYQCCKTEQCLTTPWVLWRRQIISTGIIKFIYKADKNRTAQLSYIVPANLKDFRNEL